MRIFGLAASVLLIALSASAQKLDPPMFAAFKSICIDTGARPPAVKAVVEMAGGVPRGPSGSTNPPFAMTITSWDITLGGHKMIVNAGTMRAPIAPRQLGDMVACGIDSPDRDDDSVAAIRDWVGVPPSPPSPSAPAWVTMYEFQEDGLVRTPIIDDAAQRAASVKGAASTLMIMQPPPNGTQVQLIHVLGPAPAN